MFAYIYIIFNCIFTKDVYKIEITRQNKKQIQKMYNKFYPNNIQILNTIIVDNAEKANKIILTDLKKYYIPNTKNFFNCNLDKINITLNKLIINTNYTNIYNNLINFINISCHRKNNSKIKVNEIHNLFNKNMDYIKFIYIIKNNLNIIYENNNYYLVDYEFNHNNIFEQFIKNNIIFKKGLFLSSSILINNFNKWYHIKYPYLKKPFKNIVMKNIKKYMEQYYGKLSINYTSSKCKSGWNDYYVKI
jgi:hypothetical protein